MGQRVNINFVYHHNEASFEGKGEIRILIFFRFSVWSLTLLLILQSRLKMKTRFNSDLE